MTSNEMDSIACVVGMIDEHHKAERHAWSAYMDADDAGIVAARKAWKDACIDLATTVDIYLPEIKRALASARKVAA